MLYLIIFMLQLEFEIWIDIKRHTLIKMLWLLLAIKKLLLYLTNISETIVHILIVRRSYFFQLTHLFPFILGWFNCIMPPLKSNWNIYGRIDPISKGKVMFNQLHISSGFVYLNDYVSNIRSFYFFNSLYCSLKNKNILL